MEQELTLYTLKPLLLQSDAENCSDALFLKKLFYNIIDESVMQKKLICKSASSLKAFMQGNRRRNRQQKRTYANYHGTKLLKEIFEIKAQFFTVAFHAELPSQHSRISEKTEQYKIFQRYFSRILSAMSAMNSEFVGFPFPVLIVYPNMSSRVSILPRFHATSIA